MGFNPFRSLKKIVKKVGKGIKKIGRGLKKIMAKIAKPFAKLGPLGTIALGMLMPWAAGAIWQGMTGTALNLANFGQVATGLTSAANTNLFTKAVGYVMKGIHWGATKVKTAYQFVSDKISSGIDTLTNKAQEVFGGNADAGDLLADTVKNAPEIDVQMSPIETKDMGQYFKNKAQGIDADKILTDVIDQKTTEKGFFGKAIDKAKESALGAIGTNIEEALSPQEANMGSGIMYDTHNFLGDNVSFTKYNESDLTLQNKGYSFGGPAYDANITTSSFGQDEYYNWFNSYKSDMQNFLTGPK